MPSGASSLVGGFQLQDVIASMFFLILVYLLATNWKGVSQLIVTTGSAVTGLTRTLQGKG